MAKWVTLHHHITPPRDNIPISVDPLPMDYLVTMEDDIKCEVHRLRSPVLFDDYPLVDFMLNNFRPIVNSFNGNIISVQLIFRSKNEDLSL